MIIREIPQICPRCDGTGREVKQIPDYSTSSSTSPYCLLCSGSGRIYIRETIFEEDKQIKKLS